MEALRSSLSVVAINCALLVLGAQPAVAQVGDPPAGSPPGAVYELPLDRGRGDAAPNAGGQGSGPGSGTRGTTDSTAGVPSETSTGSLYRSENNLGSSSQIPGDPKLAHKPDSGMGLPPAEAVDAGNTSEGQSFVLLGLIVLAALGIGYAVSRGRRLGS